MPECPRACAARWWRSGSASACRQSDRSSVSLLVPGSGYRPECSVATVSSVVRLRLPATGALVLPAALHDAGHVPFEGQLAEAQTAQGELAQEGPRPAAPLAAVAVPDGELELLLFLGDFCGGGHVYVLRLVGAERHADQGQQAPGLFIGL